MLIVRFDTIGLFAMCVKKSRTIQWLNSDIRKEIQALEPDMENTIARESENRRHFRDIICHTQ